MSEIKEKYMNEIPFEETCDTYCNYIENLKEIIDEQVFDNEILRKENMSLKKVLTEMKDENKEYRDKVDRLKAVIEKYERGINDEPRKII